jgi:hypothetical protein
VKKTGMMEYWSVGVMGKAWSFAILQYSNTPTLLFT